ncbi:MAG: hypothetical protein AAGI38_17285, partial [Bacteroidota bacterium]
SIRVTYLTLNNLNSMRGIYKIVITLTFALLASGVMFGQGAAEYKGGLKVKLSDDGSKYFRLITWHQVWATSSDLAGENTPDFDMTFLLRRSRFLAYAQINKRFLILTHFGLNSMGPNNMGVASPLGPNGGNSEFFMHDAWAEYTIFPKKLYIGAGLHYWNGVSRLTNSSTLNLLTLDAPLFNWFSIGTSDQFARHLGVYAKGKIGKLDYRIALNDALNNPGVGQGEAGQVESVYRNVEKDGGGKIIQGYFNYQFLDQEGNTLPYFVGSYLGGKKVLNVGAGFFTHFNGTSTFTTNDAGIIDTTINTATTFSADVFYDAPIGDNGSAITAYGVVYVHDWGDGLVPSGVIGAATGNIYYAQVGYVLPDFSDKGRLQPYVAYSLQDLDVWEDFETSSQSILKLGANWYLAGHHAKITGEYVLTTPATAVGDPNPNGQIRIQAMIWL